MRTPNLTFASAIGLMVAAFTAPAHASTTICYTNYTQADGSAQAAFCTITPVGGAQVNAETWSSFFNSGTGATYTKLVGSQLVSQYQLVSFILCANGAVESNQTGTNVADDLVGCPSGVLGSVGQGGIAIF